MTTGSDPAAVLAPHHLQADLSVLVIQALCSLARRTLEGGPVGTDGTLGTLGTAGKVYEDGWTVYMTAKEVADEIKWAAECDETPLDEGWITPHRLGRRLAALRIPQANSRAAGHRYYMVHRKDLQGLVKAYRLEEVCRVPNYEMGCEIPGI
jgi:hypothetical protein